MASSPIIYYKSSEESQEKNIMIKWDNREEDKEGLKSWGTIGKEAGVQGYMEEESQSAFRLRGERWGRMVGQAGSLLQNKSNLVYLHKSNLG